MSAPSRTAVAVLLGSLASGVSPGFAATGGISPSPDVCVGNSTQEAKPGTDSTVALETSAYSPWETGPGSITYTLTTGAETTVTLSGNASFDISALIASANATFGISVSQSSTRSQTWSMSLDIPSGTWRAMWYHEGHRFEVGNYTFTGGCVFVWNNLEWMTAPNSSTDVSQFDLAKEQYPGSTYTSWPA